MNRYSVSARLRSGVSVVDARCDCSDSKSARRTRAGRGESSRLPHLIDDVVLVTLQRGALSAGDERAQEVSTLAVVRREGTAPPVATECDDVDAVGPRQRRVLALRVDDDGATTTLEGAVQHHLHHGALAGADRAGHDHVRIGDQARRVRVEGIEDERAAALALCRGLGPGARCRRRGPAP